MYLFMFTQEVCVLITIKKLRIQLQTNNLGMKYKEDTLKIRNNIKIIINFGIVLALLLILYLITQRHTQFNSLDAQQHQNYFKITNSSGDSIQIFHIQNWKNKQRMEKAEIKNVTQKMKQTKDNRNKKLPIFYDNNEANITFQQLLLALNLKNTQHGAQNITVFQQQHQYYKQKYKIKDYKEQPFCIIVPSYNNVNNGRYLQNINSILQQQYENYHIIYIDDASTDGTGRKIIEYAKIHKLSEERLRIIINEERKMALFNIYKAGKQYCKPYEILIIIDGDDQLLGKQVFKFFNSQFQSKKIWLMYTNFIMTNGGLGYSKPYGSYVIKNNYFRKFGLRISHLRAFYAKLLFLIKQEDLRGENEQWFAAANDIAIYMPILQMARNRMAYLPQLCYIYNSNTQLNNHITKFDQQKRNEKIIKLKSPYNEIKELFNDNDNLHLQLSLNKRTK